MVPIYLAVVLSLLAAGSASSHQPSPAASPDARDHVDLHSSNERYVVRFAEPRSDGDTDGRLYSSIRVLDTRTERWRTVRRAAGRRGRGVFEGFAIYDEQQAWSPDGRYLAYWDDYCTDESGVAEGVVCHIHEVHILAVDRTASTRHEVVLSRYEFGGWMAGRPHSLWQLDINRDTKKVRTLH